MTIWPVTKEAASEARKRIARAISSCSPVRPSGTLDTSVTAQGSGSIVNICSVYGHEGANGASVYVGSKHAAEGMTKSAALEAAGSDVRVNAVAPGPIETGMLNRFTGTAERKAA